MSVPDRKARLDKSHSDLSVRSQCQLLSLTRSGTYRKPKAANRNADLAVMRRIDELYTRWPFMGSRRMVLMLGRDGISINRKRVQRLMRAMGLEALGPKPNTSKPATGHKVYPYLLRDLEITRPNHVWCTDMVIPPILRGLWRRTYAAICVCICRFNFWIGVIPPRPMLGRSLLYVQSQSVA